MNSVKPYERCKLADRDNFCTYHVAIGHHTNDCQSLLNAIRKLIKDRYIYEPTPRLSTAENSPLKPENRVAMVETDHDSEKKISACVEKSVMVIESGIAEDTMFDLIRKAQSSIPLSHDQNVPMDNNKFKMTEVEKMTSKAELKEMIREVMA